MSIVIDVEKEASVAEFLSRHAGRAADFARGQAAKVPGYAKKVVDFAGSHLGGDQLYGAIKDNVSRTGRVGSFLSKHPDAGAAAAGGAALVGGGLLARKLMKKAPAAVKELSRIEKIKAMLAAHPKATTVAALGTVAAGTASVVHNHKEASLTETKEAGAFASAVGNMGAKAVQYGIRAASLGGRLDPRVGAAGGAALVGGGLLARKLMKKAPAVVAAPSRIQRVMSAMSAHPGATAAGVVGLGAAGGYAASRSQN